MADACPICQGTGFKLHTGEGGVVSGVRCDCGFVERGDRLLRMARIPKRYEHCELASFEIHDRTHETVLRVAREWAELYPVVEQGLMLLGEPGRGKTHLAVAVARELIRTKGTRVVFHEQRALLKSLQGTFESGAGQRESQVLGPVLEAEVLVLDDLGAGRTTLWARDVLHDIIAHRYNEQRPLIITSNLQLEAEARPPSKGSGRPLDQPLTLSERLGEALISRLHEMCHIVRLGGNDYRTGVRAHRPHP